MTIQHSRFVLACVGLIGAGTVGAEPGGQDTHPCASIADDSRRLACYDDAFGRTVEPIASGVSTASRVVVSDPVDDWGLSETAKRARDPEKAKQTMPEQISGTVATVGRRTTGEFIVTLENGQVWLQAETLSRALLKPGDVVTIRKAALGSYLLVAPNKVSTRVRRLR